MQKQLVIFLTGASGAGKTTLLNTLKKESVFKDAACLHFDSIGVPSEAEMIEQYGSPSEWQRALTEVWVEKIKADYQDKKLVILDGQINTDFIVNACKKRHIEHYKIILLHCDNTARHNRLHCDRNQPELVNDTMDNWAAFLKKQAINNGGIILDTTSMNPGDVSNEFIRVIKNHTDNN